MLENILKNHKMDSGAIVLLAGVILDQLGIQADATEVVGAVITIIGIIHRFIKSKKKAA